MKQNSTPKPLDLDKIMYLKGDNAYSWIYPVDAPKYLMAYTLKEYHNGMIRIHKQTLINPRFVVSRERNMVTMTDGSQHTISRRKMKETKLLLKEYHLLKSAS